MKKFNHGRITEKDLLLSIIYGFFLVITWAVMAYVVSETSMWKVLKIALIIALYECSLPYTEKVINTFGVFCKWFWNKIVDCVEACKRK